MSLYCFCYSTFNGTIPLINFRLNFQEEITDEENTIKLLNNLIIEKVNRTTLPNGIKAIIMDPFLIYQESLQSALTNPDFVPTFATPPQ